MYSGGTKFLLTVADLIAKNNQVSFFINAADQRIINRIY
jgi:hypothetical protein